LRDVAARFIITFGRSGGQTMCHESWWFRNYEEREASRELWDEFEQTRPLSDPDAADQEAEVTLERPESRPVATER
jgi:hypothetical protein